MTHISHYIFAEKLFHLVLEFEHNHAIKGLITEEKSVQNYNITGNGTATAQEKKLLSNIQTQYNLHALQRKCSQNHGLNKCIPASNMHEPYRQRNK